MALLNEEKRKKAELRLKSGCWWQRVLVKCVLVTWWMWLAAAASQPWRAFNLLGLSLAANVWPELLDTYCMHTHLMHTYLMHTHLMSHLSYVTEQSGVFSGMQFGGSGVCVCLSEREGGLNNQTV